MECPVPVRKTDVFSRLFPGGAVDFIGISNLRGMFLKNLLEKKMR